MLLVELNAQLYIFEAPTHILLLKKNKKKILKGTIEVIDAYLDGKDSSKFEIQKIDN